MTGVLLTAARRQAARSLGTAGAVVIAVAFVVATLVLSDSLARTLSAGLAAPFAGVDAYVAGDAESVSDGTAYEAVTPEVVAAVAAAPGVQAVAVAGQRGVTGPDAPQGYAGLAPLADDPRLRWEELTAGRWPEAPGEAVAGTDAFAVGEQVRLQPYGADGEPGPEAVLTVVGTVEPGTSGGTPDLLASAATLDEVAPGAGWEGLRVLGTGDEEAVAVAVREALAGDGRTPGLVVRTGDEQTAAVVSAATGDRVAPTLVLLVFAAISVLVAALVIANTRTVVLAQRARQMALLRCVGATRGQLVRSSLGEAALIGLGASLLGVAVGVGIAALASAVVDALDAPVPVADLAVRPGALLVGLGTGVGVTVAAALAPTVRASRVAPVAALRPVEAVVSTRRMSRLRIAAGVLLAVPPAIGLAAVAVLVERGGTETFLLAFALGVVSFVGVVVLAQPLAAGVVGALDRGARRVLPPAAAVALANARRNPHRTGATAAALLVGVTLIATVTVGAATLRASSLELLAGDTPADVVVQASEVSAPVPASVAEVVGGVEGVAGVVVLSAPTAGEVSVVGQSVGVEVHAVTTPAAEEVLLVGDTSAPPPGTLRVGEGDALGLGLGDGAEVRLAGAEGEVAVRVSVLSGDEAPPVPLVAASDLEALTGGEVYQREAIVRLDEGLSRGERADAVGAVEEALYEAAPEAVVTAPVLERDQFGAVLDGVLAVTAGLLGVAVVIAVVGVGTTLSLGVHERTQENGLLRALGMTRGQVRGVVVGEAVLLSLLAAALGVVIGAGYGASGSAAVLGSAGFVLDVPAGRVLALVAATVLAGVLAAAVPAVRAGRVSPVAAMAE